MRAFHEPLTAKQQLAKIGLGCLLLMPMMSVAVFCRNNFMGQHFGAITTITIIAISIVPISSRTWIRKIT
jgi:hypothetical protein